VNKFINFEKRFSKSLKKLKKKSSSFISASATGDWLTVACHISIQTPRCRSTHEVKSFALALAIVTIDGDAKDNVPAARNKYSNKKSSSLQVPPTAGSSKTNTQ